MSNITLNLDADLAAMLHGSNQPVQQTVLEFVVLELYRRGAASSGKAAQMLNLSRWEFVRHASRLGIAFYDMTDDEWEIERLQTEAL